MTVSAADWPSEYYKVTKLIHALCVLFNHLRTRVWTKQLKKRQNEELHLFPLLGPVLLQSNVVKYNLFKIVMLRHVLLIVINLPAHSKTHIILK